MSLTLKPEIRPHNKLLSRSSVLLLLVFLVGCGPREPEPPQHVLFITVDTLRADHLSLYGYPRATSPGIDAFAEGAVVFDRAFAQWPKTGTSFASIFTGQYPQTTGLTHKAALRIPDEYLTLPEFLKEKGFTNVAVISNAVLGDHLGWNRGFDEYLETWKRAPETSEDPVEYRKWINAGIVNELALPLLEKYKDSERLFAWIHYSDPHAPYLLPENERNPFVDDEHYTGDEQVKLHDPRATALGERRDLKYYVAQYDANVRYTDRHIRELLEHARSQGILDRALVVLTADHGESLGEHDYFFGHGRLPYNNGVHVPLLFSYPPALATPGRVPAPVELLDLYPTLREWLAPEMPVPGLEGESLLPLLRGEAEATGSDREHFAFSQAGGGSPTTHFRSVQDARFKLIYHPPFKHRQQEVPRRWELYQLEDDPGEIRNLAQQGDSADLRRLHRELRAWMKGSEWIRRPPSEIEAQSQETRKALRALGYTE